DLRRRGMRIAVRRSDAELAVGVRAPGPDRAVRFQGRRMRAPAVTLATPVRKPAPDGPLTCTAALRAAVVPSPSAPYSLRPHAQTAPSDFNATEWTQPAATLTTPVRKPAPSAVTTLPGKADAPVTQEPSWPWLLSPQARTAPSEVNATVWP